MYIQALITLTGSAQKLSTATGICDFVGVTSNGALGNLSCSEIHIQPEGANANVVYFGDSHITTSLFAFRMPAGDTGDPPPPMVIGPYSRSPIKLDDMYVLGTAAQKVHLGLLI